MDLDIKNDVSDNKFKYNCEKCSYNCKYESEWVKHINTEIHKTGIKKRRSDYKEPFKCEKCDYTSKNNVTLKKHFLNEHANKEQRKKEFKFYCDICDFGAFYQDLYEIHINTEKHKKIIKRLK